MHFGTLVDQPPPPAAASPDATGAAHPCRGLWPLPAIAAWSLAWLVYAALARAGAPAWLPIGAATLAGVSLSALGSTPWRRVILAAGFPLSLAFTGVASTVPGWAWLVPLALLALVYPLNAWRDAPFFPTPARALQGLARLAPLDAGARVLDAGCGLGHGLAELRREYPQVRLEGIEWSWPLAVAARLRARVGTLDGTVAQGDMWRRDWRAFALVYVFQRPESLPRAVAKARRELTPGAWLASLEFEATELVPQATLALRDERTLWLYQAPFVTAATSGDANGLNAGARGAVKKT
jgi:hypothetical protein